MRVRIIDRKDIMDQWWVIRRNRDPVGPVSTDLVLQGISAGRVPADALVCELGGSRWRPITEVSAFARELARLAEEESVTEALPSKTPRSAASASSRRRRSDQAAERTIVDESPLSSDPMNGAKTERPARTLRPFEDSGEQTIVERSPLSRSEPPSGDERSTRRTGLRRFDDGDEPTIVDVLPLRPSEPPS